MPETLLPLSNIRDAEALGIHAIARVKLTTVDSRFTAYLAGFDGADTFFGLLCAREIHLGRLYFSGLAVAWMYWGIHIQVDQKFKTTSLQRLTDERGFGAQPQPDTIVSFCDQLRGRIRARLCMNLAKEPHHFYCNK